MSETVTSLPDAAISFPFLGESFSVNPPGYIDIFGFHIYLYGIIIACGFILAGAYMFKRRSLFGFTQDNIIDVLLCAVPSGIVGARLYYVLFNFSDYFGPGKGLKFLKIWNGGLAIYGGIIAGAIAIVIYCRVKKIPIMPMLDIAVFGVIIGQIMGRWGNFANREAFGAVTDSFFRMGLTTDAGTIYVHPTFLYESVWNLIGFLGLHFYTKKRKYDGELFLMYVAWYGFGRFLIEGLRSDSLYIGSTDIRVSQLLAAISFAAALVLLIHNRRRGHFSPDMLYVNKTASSPEEPENVVPRSDDGDINEEQKNTKSDDALEIQEE